MGVISSCIMPRKSAAELFQMQPGRAGERRVAPIAVRHARRWEEKKAAHKWQQAGGKQASRQEAACVPRAPRACIAPSFRRVAGAPCPALRQAP